MPPHGWRTMFWVVDQSGRVLVGPRERVPEDGTQRSIVVNGAEVGKVIASPVERLTRNTDINFDRQQKAHQLADRRPCHPACRAGHFPVGPRSAGAGEAAGGRHP